MPDHSHLGSTYSVVITFNTKSALLCIISYVLEVIFI